MKTRNILPILPVVIMALFSCDEDNKLNGNSNAPQVTLSLETDCAEVITRATEPGQDVYNENLIGTIHWYFFDNSTDEWIMDGTQAVNKTASTEVSLSGFDVTKYGEIGAGPVKVLVIANVPTAPAGASGDKIDDIKATALTLSSHGVQPSLAMCGEGTLTKTTSGTIKKASTPTPIELKRIASKFRIRLSIKASYTDSESNVWTPETGVMQMKFKNLEPKGKVSSTDANSATLNTLDFSASGFMMTSAAGADPQVWQLADPVYSYPRTWTNEDTDYPYLYITLPWTKDTGGGSVTETTYYRVIFPTSSFDSNNLYDITVNLDGLGSMIPEKSVTIDDMSLIINGAWKDAIPDVDKNNTDADMSVPHVLAIDKNEYIIYNENSISIPFITSHDCSIKDATSTEISTNHFPANSDSGKGTAATITVDNEHDVINFTHTLTNMPSSGKKYDYKEFVHTYKLYHTTNEGSVYEFVTIRQRPSICIEEESSSPGNGKIFVHGAELIDDGNSDHSYRILKTSDPDPATGATGIQRVSTGVLPTEGVVASYMIGDPRDRQNPVTDFTNLLKASIVYNHPTSGTSYYYRGQGYTGTPTASSTYKFSKPDGDENTYYHLNGEARTTVEIYYPTITGTASENIIAPEFIITSGYPGVNSHYMNIEAATLRCATYQEIGYPAGRWRLPTKAEMAYMARLQNDDHIKDIFNTHSSYVCANGIYMVDGTTLSISSTDYQKKYGSVRCVYDSWYWDQVDKENGWDLTRSSRISTFTYGDMEIQ